jgi:hypothetical protein
MLPREKIEAEIAYLEIVGRKAGNAIVATSPKPASTTFTLHASARLHERSAGSRGRLEGSPPMAVVALN